MKFMIGENWRNPEKTYPDPFDPPRNPHGVTETRTRDPSGGRRAACGTRLRNLHIKINLKINISGSNESIELKFFILSIFKF